MTPREAAARPAMPAGETAGVTRARRVIASRALFADQHEIVIVHGADEYRLRITKAGKLILTK